MIPVCNSQGNKIKETDEYDYFRREAVRTLISDFAKIFKSRHLPAPSADSTLPGLCLSLW